MKRIVWLLCVLVGLASSVSAADPPALINYQGVLRDSADKPVPNGSYAMVFRFYSIAGPGGSAILQDAQTVTVTGGLFSAEIGKNPSDGPGPGLYDSLAKVFADFPDLYLEVQVGGETLAPRIHLASAGYALNARKVRGIEITSTGPLNLYVNVATGDDANDGLSSGSAKRTIQGAVNAIPPVLSGDVTVRIADGVYAERVTIMPHTRTGLHWIRLIGNTAFPELVAVDGAGLPAPEIQDSAIAVLDLPVEIAGITVRNWGPAGDSFGLHVMFASHVEVRDCRFVDNTGSDGAIVADNGAEVQVSESVVNFNARGVGVGNHGRLDIRDYVEISGNTEWGAFAWNGGLVSFNPSVPGRCTIFNNNLSPGDHSTIQGYARCSVNASECVTDPGNPTSRCQP